MSRENRNIFGKKLENLLMTVNVKNATVAAELNYDVSYISKWITGKAVPSRKNVEKILTGITKVVMEQGSKDGIELLSQSFGVKNSDKLRQAVKSSLRDAYFEAGGEVSDNKYINNAVFTAAPRGNYALMNDYAMNLNKDKPMDIAVMVDLFALDRASKLKMAGMDGNGFGMKEKRRDYKIDYIIDISSLKGSSVYDVILFMHMITGFSLADFNLYYSNLAEGKMIIAVKEEFASMSVLGLNKQFMCTTSTREKRSVEEMYEGVMSVTDPEKCIFFPAEMTGLLTSHEYLQSLLSKNSRWLVGHMTEQFISPELFYELSEEYFGKGNTLAEEAEHAYLIASDAIRRNRVKMMIYNRALVDFVFSGELDFFNNRVMLTSQQRERELAYLTELFGGLSSENLKIIRDGFSDDFKYVTNPCIFLSDTLDYLRLENKQFTDNLMLVKDKAVRKVFDEFYDEIWALEDDLVTSDHEEVMDKIKGFAETSVLLANVKSE